MFSISTFLASLAVISAVASGPIQSRQSTYFGDATFYGTGLGACGINSVNTDLIMAVSASFFDTFPGAGNNPNDNPVCGRRATVHFQGASTTVIVVDRCPACAFSDIDLSPEAFGQLSSLSVGRIKVSWSLD